MDSEKEKSKQKSYVFGPNNKEIRKKQRMKSKHIKGVYIFQV